MSDDQCVAAVRDYLRGGVDDLARTSGVPFPDIFDQAEDAIRRDPGGFPHPNPNLRGYWDAERTLHEIRQGRHDMTTRWCEARASGAEWHAGDWRPQPPEPPRRGRRPRPGAGG